MLAPRHALSTLLLISLASSAAFAAEPAADALSVAPTEVVLRGRAARQRLLVTQGTIDRTREASFRSEPPNIVAVSPDGRNVYVITGTGIFKAFDFNGKEIWTRDIQHDYGNFGLNWGYASSPLLFEDSLYIQVLHGMKTDDPSYVMRVDKKDGKKKAWSRRSKLPASRMRKHSRRN